jgi:hypothetical protein
MATIAAWIAKVGINPTFIAFNAHCWFAAFVVSQALARGVHWYFVVPAAVVVSGVKEYAFDAKNEVPKQTFWDNTQDFLGYMSGVLAGIVAHGI